MHLRPQLRALRGDDTPQRLAQQELHRAIARWRARPEVAAVLVDLAAFSAGSRSLAECPALAALFDDGGDAALRLAGGLVDTAGAGLARAPLGHVPLRHFADGTNATLLLAQAGNVSLSLVALDGEALRRQPPPASVGFSPSECWEQVLAGAAQAELVEARPAGPGEWTLERLPITLTPGRPLMRDCLAQALLIDRIDGCLVSLRLQRRRENPPPAREHCLATGALIHQSAGSPRESRQELMLALLGRMKRADAAPIMAEMALEPGAAALRWQALRECLALDTLTGFRTLSTIARSAADPLAHAAGALRAQLIETHPQLAGIDPCPA